VTGALIFLAFIAGTAAFVAYTGWLIHTQRYAEGRPSPPAELWLQVRAHQTTRNRRVSRRSLPTIHLVIYGRVRVSEYSLPDAYVIAPRSTPQAERVAPS